MRKFMISFFVTSLLFCMTSNLNGQRWGRVHHSDGLEHLKMMEQFVGKWQYVSNDTVRIFEIIPSQDGEGYLSKYHQIVNGKTENVQTGLIGRGGVDGDRKIEWSILYPQGGLLYGHAKFMSETNVTGYFYNTEHNARNFMWEWELQTPDKFETISIQGSGSTIETWQKKPRVWRYTWKRVK